MAIIFADGFEDSAVTDYSGAGYAAISPSGGRLGGKALYSTTSNNSALINLGFARQTELYMHIAVKAPSGTSGTLFSLMKNDANDLFEVLEVTVVSSGAVTLKTNNTILHTTEGGFFPFDVYNSIQIYVKTHVSDGEVRIRMNGATSDDIAVTGTAVGGSSAGYDIDEIMIFAAGYTSGSDILFDDIVVCDTTGTVNNSWTGDVRVDSILPAADGDTTTMTTSTGSDHYALVDEVPPDNADYVYSNTPGDVDLFQMGDLPHNPVAILGVVQVARMSKTDAGSRGAGLVVKSGGVESTGPDLFPPTGGTQVFTRVIEQNPNGNVPWTVSAINALQAGVKITL